MVNLLINISLIHTTLMSSNSFVRFLKYSFTFSMSLTVGPRLKDKIKYIKYCLVDDFKLLIISKSFQFAIENI